MGEFGWLKRLLPQLYWPKERYSQLCIGPGDDAGALWISGGKVLVATTDAMVEGVHFERKWFPWEALGYKVLSVNLSDLAAMGKVRPLGALVTASFPGDTPVETVDNFFRGLDKCARRWKVGLLGGDTVGSKGPWTISVAMFGEGKPKELIRRGGAHRGDWIVTSGPVGLAAAGLEILQLGRNQEPWMKPLLASFCTPKPRFDVGEILGAHRLATSLTDSSDGLEASVRLLAEASGLSAELNLPKIPIHSALKKWAISRRKDPMAYILRGGEDYELVFTCRPKDWPAIHRRLSGSRVVGQMISGTGQHRAITPEGIIPLRSYGYNHFIVKD